MNTYLVTGGCGFIGSHIAEALVQQGCRVRILDNLSSGHLRNIETFRDRVEVVEADIRDCSRLAQAMDGVTHVFHLAALVSVFDSVERPLENHEINLTGTLNVLRAAAAQGVHRVVLASSAAVYGNDPILPKVETMRPDPESPYGLAKITKEYYASVFSNLYNLPTVCLRYFNVYGPRQDPGSPYSGVISIFVKRVLDGPPVRIFGDGKQTRDFVFVKDVVQANLLAMHAPDLKGGEVFNIATGVETSLLDLLQTLNRLSHTSLTPEFLPERAGDIRYSLADISRAEQALRYRPQYSLAEGLAQLLDSCRGT